MGSFEPKGDYFELLKENGDLRKDNVALRKDNIDLKKKSKEIEHDTEIRVLKTACNSNDILVKRIKELEYTINEYTSKFKQLVTYIEKVEPGKLDLDKLDNIISFIKSSSDVSSINTPSPDIRKPTAGKVPEIAHALKCECIGCEVADLSNQLYYNCIDYTKDTIDETAFKSLAVNAINECKFISQLINTKENQLLIHYRESYQRLGIKYRTLLKQSRNRL